MSVYFLLLFAHVMLFAYWLGSDVGVFYGMRFVLDLPGFRSKRAGR